MIRTLRKLTKQARLGRPFNRQPSGRRGSTSVQTLRAEIPDMDFTAPSTIAAASGYTLDPAQAEALRHLDRVARSALAGPPEITGGRRGIYLWGPPGRGKTFLMDCIRTSLSGRVIRMHFHEFFRFLHCELHTRYRGQSKPVQSFVADNLGSVDVVCFDEFHVHDIADAMILQAFLDALMRLPVHVVLTSNYPPQKLLSDPQFHERFGYGIELLESNFDILPIDDSRDYRERGAEGAENFLHPLGPAAETLLAAAFKAVGDHEGGFSGHAMILDGRKVQCHARGSAAAWFTFHALCGTERSYLDYLTLADRFSLIVLSDITARELNKPFAAQRFVWLIDVLYDRGIRLMLSSEQPILDLLGSVDGAHDLFRTASRLKEMAARATPLPKGTSLAHHSN